MIEEVNTEEPFELFEGVVFDVEQKVTRTGRVWLTSR